MIDRLRRLVCYLRSHRMRHVDVTEGTFWYCARCLRTDWAPHERGSDSTAVYLKNRPEPLPKGPRVTPMPGRLYGTAPAAAYWVGEDE